MVLLFHLDKNYDILLLLTDSRVPLNAFAYGGQHADACYDLLSLRIILCLFRYTESFGYGHSLVGQTVQIFFC